MQVPGTAVPDTHLGANEIEIGLGIHNESGHSRISPVPPLNELIPTLLNMITSTTDRERSFVSFKNDGTDRVALLVNNLGGLSELELGGVVAEVRRALDKSGIKIMRLLSGSFMVCSGQLRLHLLGLMIPSARQVSTCPDFQSPCFYSPPQTTQEFPPLISSCLYSMTVLTPQDGSGPRGPSQSYYLPLRPFLP
jgi:dihydroxyacetone kinase